MGPLIEYAIAIAILWPWLHYRSLKFCLAIIKRIKLRMIVESAVLIPVLGVIGYCLQNLYPSVLAYELWGGKDLGSTLGHSDIVYAILMIAFIPVVPIQARLVESVITFKKTDYGSLIVQLSCLIVVAFFLGLSLGIAIAFALFEVYMTFKRQAAFEKFTGVKFGEKEFKEEATVLRSACMIVLCFFGLGFHLFNVFK